MPRRARADRRERGGVRIMEDGLELSACGENELARLRALMVALNGPACAQPFLQEGPPGHFRLWVGDAAGRMRTARGIG